VGATYGSGLSRRQFALARLLAVGMNHSMVACREDPQILYSVVLFVAIDVMNLLSLDQFAAYVVSHDHIVLVSVTPTETQRVSLWNPNENVTL
jgi:hypothetical protein